MTDPPKGWYLDYINEKLNTQLLYNLGVSFLDIYPREMKTFTSKTCAQKCLAALFITATNCKPPRCPLTSKQLNKQGPVLWNSPQG